jgi:hypothetical protein
MCSLTYGSSVSRHTEVRQEFLSKLSWLCLKQRKELWHYPSLTENKEDLKLATGPYCRQYESTACFFSRLPICLAKMCLVVLRHILELPRHTMVLLCTFWTCKGIWCPLQAQKCVQHVPKLCLGIIHIYSTKMIWWKADKEKKKQAILLHYFGADLMTCHKTWTWFGMDKEPVETNLQILKVPCSLFESSAQGVTTHYPGVSVAQCTEPHCSSIGFDGFDSNFRLNFLKTLLCQKLCWWQGLTGKGASKLVWDSTTWFSLFYWQNCMTPHLQAQTELVDNEYLPYRIT